MLELKKKNVIYFSKNLWYPVVFCFISIEFNNFIWYPVQCPDSVLLQTFFVCVIRRHNRWKQTKYFVFNSISIITDNHINPVTHQFNNYVDFSNTEFSITDWSHCLSSSYVSDSICSLSTCFLSFLITRLKKFLMGFRSGEHGGILNIMAPILSNAFYARILLRATIHLDGLKFGSMLFFKASGIASFILCSMFLLSFIAFL